MARAAAMTALLDKELGSLSGSAVQSRSTMRTTASDVDKIGASSNQAGDSINQLTGRLRLLVDAVTLLGPALVPIGAVAIPAITGLANQMGILAVGAGTAVLAFQGVGDTFKALEKARLDPTVENLAEVQRLMSDLEPAARGFVAEIDKMRPAFDSIQNSAAAGLFPGLTEGLSDLESMTGPIRRAVGEIATGFGDAAAAEADAFDSERGREFIAFLGNEAPQTLSKLFETIRNLAAGMGELWMTFDAPNDDFADWLLGQAKAFDSWSQTLGQTQGFEDFLSYVSNTGPKVADALGAIANMVVQVVEAAAPLGGPVLEGLEFFADTVSAVADSNLGAPLLAAAAAAVVMNRALQLSGALLTRVTAQQAAGAGAATSGLFAGTKANAAQVTSGISAISAKAQGARSSIAGFGADLAKMRGEYSRMGPAAALATSGLSNTTSAAQRVRSSLASTAATAGKAGAAVAAVGVLSTEAGQGLGVTNTALLGMTGAMVGPWGAAVGSSVGLMLDLAKVGDAAAESQRNLADAMSAAASAADFTSMQSAGEGSALVDFAQSGSALDKRIAEIDQAFTGTSAITDLAESQSAAREQFEQTSAAYGTLMTELEGPIVDSVGRSVNPSMEELTAFAQRAKPALDDLGYSFAQIGAMDDSGIRQVAAEVQEWQRQADSAAGRTDAFAKSVAELGNDALSTADSAQVMSAALQALLAPALNAEAATDAWRASLAGLKKELVDGAGFDGFTKGAMQNREATRDYANTSMERLTALAEVSTTTQGDMAKAVAETRREFIRSSVAAGLDRKAVIERANAMGLTPKMVRTVFEAAGIDKADLQIREARRNIESLPKKVQTEIRTNGIPKTMGEVNGLAKRLDLTEKERQALITLKDLASKGISVVDGKLRKTDNTTATPGVNLNDNPFRNVMSGVGAALNDVGGRTATPTVRAQDQASGIISNIIGLINQVRDKSVTITTYYNRKGTYQDPGQRAENGGLFTGGAREFASGGYGVNGQYYDRVPQIVPGGADIRWGEKATGWEAYISGKPGQRERNIGILGEAAGRLGVALADRAQPSRPVPMSPRAQSVAPSRVSVGFDGPAEVLVRMPDGSRQTAQLMARVADERIDNWERSEKARAGL